MNEITKDKLNDKSEFLLLSEICTIRRGSSPRPINDFVNKGTNPWLKITDIKNLKIKSIEQKISDDGANKGLRAVKGDVIYTNSATPGLAVELELEEAYLNDGFLLLTNISNNLDKGFLIAYLNFMRKHILRNGAGSIFTNLNKDIVEKIEIPILPISQQRKITSFLSLIDDLITYYDDLAILTSLKLKNHKVNLLRRDVSQEKKLSKVIKKYTLKNIKNDTEPVAIGKYGMRLRSEIYSKELTDDLTKNKVIFEDTITFGMGSTQIDYGVLLDNAKYCVSPAYHTYKIDSQTIVPKYLKYLFDHDINRLSKLYMIISARQGKTVDFEGLMNHKFNIPDIATQIEVVEFLTNMENLITYYEECKLQHCELKKYYLNLIFN